MASRATPAAGREAMRERLPRTIEFTDESGLPGGTPTLPRRPVASGLRAGRLTVIGAEDMREVRAPRPRTVAAAILDFGLRILNSGDEPTKRRRVAVSHLP